jgi:glyoxylase-like metal-dependent hydrolase (beta-lactamase superfamily II)
VQSELGFTFCNCIFIDDDIRAILDTGADRKSLQEVEPNSVDMVFNTHHHYDHVRGNQYFERARIMLHVLDQQALVGESEYVHYNSIDRWDELMPGYEYTQCASTMGIEPDDVERNKRVDGTFVGGDTFDCGHTRFEVIHTPGHSAGHCCFWFPEEEFLFSGDICLTQAGPWYGEVYANPDDMVKSINKIIDLKPRRLTSCHINEVYSGEEVVKKLVEFRNRIDSRQERIYNFLRRNPADLQRLAEQKLIYRAHPTPFVVFWEKLMLLKHLDRLQAEGRVLMDENQFYRAV